MRSRKKKKRKVFCVHNVGVGRIPIWEGRARPLAAARGAGGLGVGGEACDSPAVLHVALARGDEHPVELLHAAGRRRDGPWPRRRRVRWCGGRSATGRWLCCGIGLLRRWRAAMRASGAGPNDAALTIRIVAQRQAAVRCEERACWAASVRGTVGIGAAVARSAISWVPREGPTPRRREEGAFLRLSPCGWGREGLGPLDRVRDCVLIALVHREPAERRRGDDIDRRGWIADRGPHLAYDPAPRPAPRAAAAEDRSELHAAPPLLRGRQQVAAELAGVKGVQRGGHAPRD
eukprot:gene25757-biopygen6027